MSEYSRFAIYYLPAPGPLADFGARWLGWDAQAAKSFGPLDLEGWEGITATPRKYGFHATLKPPFRMAGGKSLPDLCAAVADLAAGMPAVRADGLALTRLGRFLALTPIGDKNAIMTLAADCVTKLDPFRAPPSEGELARRRGKGLNPRHEANLMNWGYPYVLDDFRFHMTLSGRLSPDQLSAVEVELRNRLPVLPAPFVVDSICLLGERRDKNFELIHRYALSG